MHDARVTLLLRQFTHSDIVNMTGAVWEVHPSVWLGETQSGRGSRVISYT